MATLKSEVIDDPLGCGYAEMTDDAVVVSLYTENRPRNKASITGGELREQIVNAEYNALTDAKKSQILKLSTNGTIDPFGFAENVVKDVFEQGPQTISNLAAARVETVSRAVELKLGRVRVGDVQRARA